MKSRTFISITIPFIGYYFINKELSKKYPDFPKNQLPKESKLQNYIQRSNDKYFAYTDIFKTQVHSNSIDEVSTKFLNSPGISNLIVESNSINTNDNTITTSPSTILNSQIIKTIQSKNAHSTIISWYWNPNYSIVSFFEKLSSYGYPWRLMNGGIHEILLVKSKEQDGIIDIYFSTAHQYNDKRDGKLIPNWVQSLHRNYARIILYLATKE
ncbi:hypothetical protein BN7_6154 [Wickerhamomyces ciferrii]|uniref:Uncharacterized protein n=1 Tax=Wickerhamomyces ciferrii (strain ATCC 14091 / BCRC 22168 / CBS 111 / JCM 3599 / NBRC 0793 / NRRL Y-1031 F-60-10) TaxID=1206466 RepID=K0KTQ7_WICCF|nr:uncharacterized protein BN7_6154 [Wickerhamomyces ciferrii]CCH46561.1 hypothetical protein BN7_6154 [Wickerhamomyces ciferrii]